MNQLAESAHNTRAVAMRWFGAMTGGDIQTALACLSPTIEWINYTPVPGYNDDMPWIGTYHGLEAVTETFKVFTGLVDVRSEELIELVVEGEQAMGVVRERSVVRKTRLDFEIEFVQWLTVREGRIVRWKSYTDPSPIIRALRENKKA